MNTDAKKVFERCAPEGHKLIEVFPYPDEDGRPVQFSARYEPVVPDGARKKTFRQFHAGANGEVIAMAMPGKMKPLYNLPELLANPNKLTLVVEGEGKANRASERFLDCDVARDTAATPPDGTDWSPLAGRTVVAWPDHDKAGDRYVAAVRRHVQLKVVKVPDTWPAKWDLGDNAPEKDQQDADLRQMIEEAVGLEEATAVENSGHCRALSGYQVTARRPARTLRGGRLKRARSPTATATKPAIWSSPRGPARRS